MSIEDVKNVMRVLSSSLEQGNTRQAAKSARQLRAMVEPVGICPMCGMEVCNYLEDDGPVWTCPRDLSPSNRYWQPSDVTTEQQDEDEVWSFCYEDHGGYCGDHMPLHSACYDKGNY